MGQPAAKENDQVQALDTHLIQLPAPSPPIPVPHPFQGLIDRQLSSDVKIEGFAAATLGSMGTNTPAHIPQGGSFVIPPMNDATIISGSATVLINGQPAARSGDSAITCNDPAPLPVGTVVAQSTVLIGG